MLKFFNFERYIFIGNIKYTNIETNSPNIIEIDNNFKVWAAMSIHNSEVDHIVKTHKNISSSEKNF